MQPVSRPRLRDISRLLMGSNCSRFRLASLVPSGHFIRAHPYGRNLVSLHPAFLSLSLSLSLALCLCYSLCSARFSRLSLISCSLPSWHSTQPHIKYLTSLILLIKTALFYLASNLLVSLSRPTFLQNALYRLMVTNGHVAYTVNHYIPRLLPL